MHLHVCVSVATSGNNKVIDAVTFPLPQAFECPLKQTLNSLRKLQEGNWSCTVTYLDALPHLLCLQMLTDADTHTLTHTQIGRQKYRLVHFFQLKIPAPPNLYEVFLQK